MMLTSELKQFFQKSFPFCIIMAGVLQLMTVATGAFAKEPVDLFDLDVEDLMHVEVSVASKRPEALYDAPGIVSVVTRKEIELFGDRNLRQVLHRMPSVYLAGSYQLPDNTVSVRGDLLSILDVHTLPLINGRPILWSYSGGVNFPLYQALPVEGLERIEMTRGPGSVLYGTNAFTGVMNLVPRTAEDAPRFKISAHGGSHDHGDVTISGGGRFQDVGVYAVARFMHADGEVHRYADESGMEQSAANRKENASLLTHIDWKGFTLDLFAAKVETFHLGPGPFWSMTQHRWEAEKVFANLGYRLELSEKTRLELNATYNYQDNQFAGRPGEQERFNFHTSDILGEATIFSNPIERLHLVAGYVAEHQANESGGRVPPTGIYSRTPQRAYAQADYLLTDQIKVLAGVTPGCFY